MSSYAVSYNFHPDFMWGTSVNGQFLLDKANSAYLYQLKDNGINSIVITLTWSDYEPLKNNYNELLIDSTRALLSRIHNLNIEPIIILDNSEIPQWQNLEKRNKNETFSTERYNYSIHLAETLIPYTNIIGIKCSYDAMYSNKQLSSETEAIQDTRKYIQSVSEQVKTGLIIPSDIFRKKKNSFLFIPKSVNINSIKGSEFDFIGINSDPATADLIKNTFQKSKAELMIYSDGVRSTAPHTINDMIIDNIYNIWMHYQQGWKIIGYFSEIDLNSETPEKNTFKKVCNSNSLELSTDNEELPEKWVRFLKD